MAGRTLRVERARSGGRTKTTKTGDARVVDLTRRLANALSRLQAFREAESLADGTQDPPPWVFASKARTPLDEARVSKTFRAVLLAAGLPRFRVYDLRHTFASQLLAGGAPITYVSAQLGHRKPTTTLMYYAHWLPAGDKGHIDRLEATPLGRGTEAARGRTPARERIQAADEAWHRSGTISTGVDARIQNS